jgi:hypothetical protein
MPATVELLGGKPGDECAELTIKLGTESRARAVLDLSLAVRRSHVGDLDPTRHTHGFYGAGGGNPIPPDVSIDLGAPVIPPSPRPAPQTAPAAIRLDVTLSNGQTVFLPIHRLPAEDGERAMLLMVTPRLPSEESSERQW